MRRAGVKAGESLAPEVALYVPAALEAITRTLRVDPSELRPLVVSLAEAVHLSVLRRHPEGIRIVRELCGEAAEFRALEYLSQVGFPTKALKPPRDPEKTPVGGCRRMTPPSVRAWWPVLQPAVNNVLRVGKDTEQQIVVSLSWNLHRLSSYAFDWYRENARALDAPLEREMPELATSFRFVREHIARRSGPRQVA